MSRLARSTLFVCVVASVAGMLSLTAQDAVAGPPGASDSSVDLPIDGFSHVVVDTAHSHLFVSGGANHVNGAVRTGVVVTNLDGSAATQLPGLSEATGMAFNGAGDTLFVAVRGDAIAAVNTATLAVTTYVTPTNTCPNQVAAASDGYVWFTYGCAFTGNDLGVLKLADGTVTTGLSAGLFGAGVTLNHPTLKNSAASPDVLILADYKYPGLLAVLSVSGTTATVQHQSTAPGSVEDVAVSPDGATFLVASNLVTTVRYKTSDLSEVASYPGPDGATLGAVAISDDGDYVGGGTNYFWSQAATFGPSSNNPIRSYDLTIMMSDDVAWSDRSLLVVTTDNEESTYTLHVLPGATLPASLLTLSGPANAPVNVQAEFTGTLTSDGVPLAGQPMHVTRQDAAGVHDLPDVATDGGGAFTVSDVPSVLGTNTYRVTYPGDAAHDSSTATVTTTVKKAGVAMSLSGPATSKRGGTLTLKGTLSTLGHGYAGQLLNVTKHDMDGNYRLRSVTTAAGGSFAVHDLPRVGGRVTYLVSYPGDAGHLPVQRSATVAVSRAMPTLSLKPNRAAYTYRQGESVTVHLGPTHSVRTVSIYAKPAGGIPKLLKSGKVNGSGDLTASASMSHNFSFIAKFAGDERYAPRTVSVVRKVRVLVKSAVSGFYARSGGYLLFHSGDLGKMRAAVHRRSRAKS